MNNKRIKIAQIGIGHNHAQGNMISMRKLTNDFEVVGVVESDSAWKEKRGDFDCYKGLAWMSEEELFNIPGLDAVAVETDGFDLIPAALRCAERNLHIHLDKPGGESLPEFQTLMTLCKERNLAIQQAYAYRYNPAIRFALEAVKSGWLGNIFEIHAVMSRYDGDNLEYRKWLNQFKGGAMYIFAGYLIDVVITMLGQADKITPFMKCTRDDGLVDNGLAVMEYKRATATIRVSVEEIDGMKHRRLIVCGTEGTIEICPLEAPAQFYATQHLTARLTLKNDIPGYGAGTHDVDCGLMPDRYATQLKEFAQIIRGEIDNPFDYDHELLLQKSLLQAAGYPI
jgi:predicted dehydrogenase